MALAELREGVKWVVQTHQFSPVVRPICPSTPRQYCYMLLLTTWRCTEEQWNYPSAVCTKRLKSTDARGSLLELSKWRRGCTSACCCLHVAKLHTTKVQGRAMQCTSARGNWTGAKGTLHYTLHRCKGLIRSLKQEGSLARSSGCTLMRGHAPHHSWW